MATTSLTKRTLKDLPSKMVESSVKYRVTLMKDLVEVIKNNDDPDIPTEVIVKAVAKVNYLHSFLDKTPITFSSACNVYKLCRMFLKNNVSNFYSRKEAESKLKKNFYILTF